MKPITKAILFLCFISLDSFGQNPISAIDSNFNDLKVALIKRSDVANNFTIVLSESSGKYSNQIKSILRHAKGLKQYIFAMSIVDSSSLALLNLKNLDLAEAIKQTLILTENDKKLKKNEDFFNVKLQLEGSENRIFIERKFYNDNCVELNRLNLLFGTERDY